MKKMIFFLLVLSSVARAGDPASRSTEESARLVQAALEQIAWTQSTHDTNTECSTYVSRVLARSGMPVGGFVSNEFDQVMATHLPEWRHSEFAVINPGGDQQALQNFLDNAADGAVFLAQWPRVGRSGHVAIIEKVSLDHFEIYQAQQGLSLPHSASARVAQLLYPGTNGGGRPRLRLFFD